MDQTQVISRLRSAYAREKDGADNSTETQVEKIHVDEIASKVAAFYERVRTLIDYREEHLLRKNTIERILRRKIFLKEFDPSFAESLIKELIRGGHLPNDSVPVAKIAEVEKIIGNLTYLLRGERQPGQGLSDWLIGVFVPAIEAELFSPPPELPLAEAMFESIRANLVLRNLNLTEREVDVQLFVAIQRALFRPDDGQLHFALLRYAYPEWGKLSETELAKLAGDMEATRNYLKGVLSHPAGPYFLKLCSREKIIFLLLGDLIQNGRPIDANLTEELLPLYRKRYRRESSRLKRLAFLSILSFLISKVLVAVAVEIPVDRFLGHSFSILNTSINVFFPPLLMFLIIIFIRLPSRNNFLLILNGIKQVSGFGEPREYLVAMPRKRGELTELIVRFAYLVALGITLFYLVRFLRWLDFSEVSVMIFVLFTSMVIATGVKVANRAKEISLEKPKPTILSFILDLITIPYMTIGRWTIAGVSKFNVLVIFFNFLIELPFQMFVEFLENFRGFITSKKDEIR